MLVRVPHGEEPRAAITRTLRRLERLDRDLAAFLPEPGRNGRASAEAAGIVDAFPPARRPALWGVPVAVKDVFRVDGLPTRAGSALDPAQFAGPESTIVRRVRQAGGLVLGKTHLDEFACCEPGPTRNPHDLRRTPGGSSAGSAAAVAAGICPVAIGSHTQRSVIGPAAYCGVVGYKPSVGTVPFDGVSVAPSIDTVGLFTRDMPDLLTAADVLLDVGAETRTRPPRLAVPLVGDYLRPVQPGALRAFHDQVAALRRAGADVMHRAVPWEDTEAKWLEAFDDALLSELGEVHREWFPRYESRYRPRTAAAVRAGQRISAGRADEARRRIDGLRPMIEAESVDIDCWICPASLGPAPLGFAHTGYVEMSIYWSWAGLPCVSLPAGRIVPPDGGHAMPVGLQCIARYGADHVLLGVASWIARVLKSRPGGPPN